MIEFDASNIKDKTEQANNIFFNVIVNVTSAIARGACGSRRIAQVEFSRGLDMMFPIVPFQDTAISVRFNYGGCPSRPKKRSHQKGETTTIVAYKMCIRVLSRAQIDSREAHLSWKRGDYKNLLLSFNLLS